MSYSILEATNTIGGRAQTHVFPSGVAADLGPHWLHAEDSELGEFVRSQNLSGKEDKSEAMRIYEGGQVRSLSDDFMHHAINQTKANAILSGKINDLPLSQIGRNEPSRKVLQRFGQGWNGLQAPVEPSAYEFLTDESTPGGFQLTGGMASLVAAMADAVGREHIHLNRPVRSVTVSAWSAVVDGERSDRAIVTASLGVLRTGQLLLDPDLEMRIASATQGLLVSRMNKIILELQPDFFRSRKIPTDLSVQVLENVPHFAHIRGAGSPLITLFTTGDRADYSETLSPAEALEYAKAVLAPVAELKDFESHLASEPVVTKWLSNPYARGAYSALFPGYRRPEPFWQGPIGVCGDSFDARFPGSLAGAFRSGKLLVDKLRG
ncbi:FAD-dependent oxidoreductase (plasmid) [Asticcacaulis sp. DW145]|nr:FAD-dependent oxidoreductase [Asticcacaulis sp. DW145]